MDLPFSLVLEHAANIRAVITFSGIPSFDVYSDLIITQISNVGTGSDNDLSSIGISNIDMYNKELQGSNLILDIYLDTIKYNTVSEYKTLEYRVQIEKLNIDTRITLQIRRSDPATLQILDVILTPNNTTYGDSDGKIHVATAVSTYISNYTLDGSKLYIAGYKVSAERDYIETVMLESENVNVSDDQMSAYTTIKWRNHVTPVGDYNIAITYGYKDEINSIDEKKEVLYYMNYGVGEYINLSNLTIDSPIYYTPNSNVDIRYYPNFSIDIDTNLDTLNLEKLKMVHVQHETITGEYNLGEGGSNLAFEYINEDSLEYDSQSKKITGTFNLVIWTIPANHCFENTYGIIYEDTDSGITSNEVSASWLLKDPALDSNYIIIPTEKKITQDQLNNIQNLDTSDYIATAYTGSFTNTYVLGEEPFIDTPDKIRIKIPENIEQYLNKTLIKSGYLGKHIIEIVDCSPSSGLSGLSDGEHNEIITKTNFIDCCIKKEDSDSGQSILNYIYSLNPSTTDTPHEISCVKTGNKIVITQKVWATDLVEVIEPEYSADYWVEFSDNQVYLDSSIVTTDELSQMNFSVTYQWLMVVQEG